MLNLYQTSSFYDNLINWELSCSELLVLELTLSGIWQNSRNHSVLFQIRLEKEHKLILVVTLVAHFHLVDLEESAQNLQ